MLKRTVREAAKKLGMDISPHDFRHYRASQMLEQGAPLEAIQEILGHSDISTTRRVYAHYSRPAIRAIFERTTLTPEDARRVHPEPGLENDEGSE
jgi:integrase